MCLWRKRTYWLVAIDSTHMFSENMLGGYEYATIVVHILSDIGDGDLFRPLVECTCDTHVVENCMLIRPDPAVKHDLKSTHIS